MICILQSRFLDIADEFRKNNGEFLYLDEVHKYQRWIRGLKNIYDSMPSVKIVFSDSSIIELSKQEVELSRSALMYSLPGQSFREYLQLANTIRFPIYTLDEILANHNTITSEISLKIPELKYFKQYQVNLQLLFFTNSNPKNPYNNTYSPTTNHMLSLKSLLP